jgi:cyanate permease
VKSRTQTEERATRLSGFVRGVGYLIAGAGSILVGYIHARGWKAPMMFVGGRGFVAVLSVWLRGSSC